MKTFTVGFIGLGLIGGSIAKAMREKHPDWKLMAYNRSAAAAQKALEESIIDHICTSMSDPSFAECDYLFLCGPVGVNIDALSHLKPILPSSCLLTDVGSVKGTIHQAVRNIGLEGQFVGGHPMTGSEKTGLEHSSAQLLENAYYILTPGHGVSMEKVIEYRDIIASLLAIPLVLSEEEHDYITAAVSHLPHLIAASLVNTVHDLDSQAQHMKMIAAGGFKDITRIASSSPDMWEHICLSNQENIVKVTDFYIEMLTRVRQMVAAGDGRQIHQLFEESRDYRDSFSTGIKGVLQPEYCFYCDIADETGAIAIIATNLAFKNINIKNIGIIHNREFEEGVLKIEFYDEISMTRAEAMLQNHNYKITKRK